MRKFDRAKVAEWRGRVEAVLSATGKTLEDVKVGRDAWYIAHYCGITTEAFSDRTVLDAHIQTALQEIFPKAVFRDRKRY